MKIDRQKVFEKYDKHCGYCGTEFSSIKDMQVDHICPKWMPQENTNRDENLMPSCRTCNHYKRESDLEGFRKKMMTLHERVCSHYIGKVALKYGIVKLEPFDGKFYFEKLKKK